MGAQAGPLPQLILSAERVRRASPPQRDRNISFHNGRSVTLKKVQEPSKSVYLSAMRTCPILMFAVLFCFSRPALPQNGRPGDALTMDQIAARLEERNRQRDAALKSYESHRLMTVTYKGTLGDGQATETVVMTFTAPASKQFTVLSATGSAFMRQSVFQRAINSEIAAAAPEVRQAAALTQANYDMRLAGKERLDAGECYVIDVFPKTASPFAYRGRVWVQSTDFAVVQIDAKPAQDPSAWISGGRFITRFGKVGDFYFPLETSSSSQVLMGGEAALTIRFTGYRILQADPVRPATAR